MTDNIGLMLGSFNPPHLGHIKTAKTAKDAFNLKTIYLLPIPQSPSKTLLSNNVTFNIKMQMCNIITAPYDWLVPSDMAKKFSSTPLLCFRDLKQLIEKFTSNDNVVIVSGDDFKQRLDLAIRILNVSRNLTHLTSKCIPITLVNNLDTRLQNACDIFNSVAAPKLPRTKGISSSAIRSKIKKGQEYQDGKIPVKLADYIERKALYRTPHPP